MLEGVIDRTILEVFLDGGRSSATTTFYPEGVLDTMEIRAGGLSEGVVISAVVWGLQSTWAAAATDGIVLGNTTSTEGNGTQTVKRDGI